MLFACSFVPAEASDAPPGDAAVTQTASPASTPDDTGAMDACTHVASANSVAVQPKGVSIPDLAGRVTDTTGIVTDACKTELTNRLAKLENTTGVQLAVLLVDSTGQQSIEQYATAVFEKWKLGQQNVDNGVLLVAALKDRRVRIEVGYGLEGAIPDVVAADIIRTRIVPAFRSGNVEHGISDAVGALAQHFEVQTQEIVEREARASKARPAPPKPVAPVFWIVLVLASVLFGAVARWRKLGWKVFVPVAYLASAVVLIVGLPSGTLGDAADIGTPLLGLLLPMVCGVAPTLLGIALVRSARVRIWTACIAAALCVCVAIGHAMGYSAGHVIGFVLSVLVLGALLIGKIGETFGFWARSPRRSSSGFGWLSDIGSGSSGSDSSDRFSGAGGKSGGGGASGSW